MINDYGAPSGGAELQMLSLRDHLRGRGHSVRLFSSDASLVDGFETQADRVCRGRTDRLQVLSQTLNLGARRSLARELTAFPPDVVHIRMFLWQMSPLILPLLRDVPVLFQAAVYKAICPNGMKLKPDGSDCTLRAGLVCLGSGCVAPATWLSTMGQLAMVRSWRSSIDLTATLSNRMAEKFRQSGWSDVRVLPNGIDDAPMRGSLSRTPLVAYAGRLSREKGIETLIDAFARVLKVHPDAELVIAGDGPLQAAIRERIAPMRPNARLVGHLPREQMEQLFAPAWVQVVPSLWHEPFGNVSTEAMMRGTAVVASEVGGQSDIVRDGHTGFLVPPGDAVALGDALSRLVGDRTLADQMGRTGRQVAQAEYGREQAVDRVLAAYDTAVERFEAKQPRTWQVE